MTTLETQLKDLETNRARQKVCDIINKEVRGCLKSAFSAHPEGPKFESIRKRLVKALTNKLFLERIKPLLLAYDPSKDKDLEAFTP